MRSIIALLLTIACTNSFAQKKYNASFFKGSGEEVMTRDSADYIRIVSEPDSASDLFNISEFYLNSKPKLVGKTSEPDHVILQGKAIEYYPSGKKKRIAEFNLGKEIGDEFTFYPNGTLYTHKKYSESGIFKGSDYGAKILILASNDSVGNANVTNGNGYCKIYSESFEKVLEEGNIKDGLRDGEWKGRFGDSLSYTTFTENYVMGTLISGSATDAKNITVGYHQREVQPSFKNGIEKFYSFVSNRINYPQSSKKNGVQGTVMLSFVVEKDGSIANIKVLQSPDNDIAIEAVRVLKLSPKWVPGLQFGKPVSVLYTLPLQFAL